MFQNVMKHEKQPARKSSFWGIRCESGKKYSQIVNQKYHISMAALDPTSVKNGKEVVSLVVERDGSEFLLCNLQKDSVLQVNLNLFFDKGEKVVFSLKGQGIVHLTGYLIKEENDPCDERLKNLNDSIMLAKDKIKSSADVGKNVQFKKNVSTLNDSWKVESKDKSSISPVKSSASPAKKSTSVSPANKSPQKQLFKAAKEESEESSDDDDDDDDETSDDNEVAKELQRFAAKRPLASVDDEDDDDDDDDEDDDLDSSDESEEELPVKKKQVKELQSNKKLKVETSTPLPSKKPVLKQATEVIEVDDDSKNGDMNSSIGRTPMPKKRPESILQQKSASKESTKAKPSKDEDSDDKMETSTGNVSAIDKNKSANQLNTSGEALGSEKKKKKKKKKSKADISQSTAANESTASVNETSFKASGDLSTAQYSKKLPGGVEYEDIRQGNGPIAKKGRLVHVYYTGKLENNKVFDSIHPGKGKPFVFKLGAGQVIKGWDLGVEGMKVGGKRRIKIPPQFGYKNQRTGPIPPGSTLYFVVELKAVS